MAEIKPFKAYRYTEKITDLNQVITPHYESVSAEQLKALYNIPYQFIKLLQPKDISSLAKQVEKWKLDQIIREDFIPGIYIYFQYYKLPDKAEVFCRKGFICNVKIHDWNEKIILRHEKTIEESLSERLEILENSELNASPAHGLYSDPELKLEKFMDESMRGPIYKITDTNGTLNTISVIQDAKVIRQFMDVLENKKIILADGHHRYKASLAYKKKHPKKNASQYICMYLTNTEENSIVTLPTHRLIKGLINFNIDSFIKALESKFIICKVENSINIKPILEEIEIAFGLIGFKQNYILELKKEFYPIDYSSSQIDILHQYIIDKISAMSPQSISIIYYSDMQKCMDLIQKNDADMAIITKEIKLEEIKNVCYNGSTFPPKSTYFYPKVLAGLIFSSIAEKKEINSVNSCFNF